MPMAIISIWAMPRCAARDATGLENETVWNALTRKGLVKAEWPHQIALTPGGHWPMTPASPTRSCISGGHH